MSGADYKTGVRIRLGKGVLWASKSYNRAISGDIRQGVAIGLKGMLCDCLSLNTMSDCQSKKRADYLSDKMIWEKERLFSSTLRFIKSIYNLLKSSQLHLFSLYPPGHFSSPIPNIREIFSREGEIFDQSVRDIPGIDLREHQQVNLLHALSKYYVDLPFTPNSIRPRRYYYENDFFSYGDAIILFSMLRHYRSRRVVEIGSGFSSAVMLDTKELFLGDSIDLTFVEPNPHRLLGLLKEHGKAECHIIQKRVQDIDLSIIESLDENDLLFVDSSHVLKMGSDVGYIIFHILPRLKRGVIVHFHDIPWPFEYSKEWLVRGMIWNEAYFLRSFLQYNDAFPILYFNAYMYKFHREILRQKMPLCLQNPGGSLWLKKAV